MRVNQAQIESICLQAPKEGLWVAFLTQTREGTVESSCIGPDLSRDQSRERDLALLFEDDGADVLARSELGKLFLGLWAEGGL